MISITLNGVTYQVPSSASDTNWAAEQVAFEQALAASINPSAAVGTPASGSAFTLASTTFGQSVVHKIKLSYTGVQVAAATKDVVVWTLPARTRVTRVVAKVGPPFKGGGINMVDMTVGFSAGGAEYLLSGDVWTASPTYGQSQAQLGPKVLGGSSFTGGDYGPAGFAGTTPVQCRFTATGSNLSDLSQGAVIIYIECVTYP